jgi:two-component system, chemotaxis family, response regulator Rcp1
MQGESILGRIPVAILTTSDAEADVLKSYDLYANCCIVKPLDLAQCVKVVRSIEDFWLSMVKLPSRPNANAG